MKNTFKMSSNNHIFCDFIRKYGKIIFLNYDNSDYSIIINEEGKFKLYKYINNMLVENKFINEDEIIKLKSEYKLAYINNIEYRLSNGKNNSFIG